MARPGGGNRRRLAATLVPAARRPRGEKRGLAGRAAGPARMIRSRPGSSVRMNPHPASAARGAPAPGSRRLAWRGAALLAGVAASVAVMAALSAAARGGSSPVAAGKTGRVLVTAGPVATVDLQAVPGQLTIIGAATGRVTLSGPLNWTGHSPVARVQVGARTLRLSYRCAAASPCTADWTLVVPCRTAVALREPAGHVVISGLAGPLQITASSVDVSATGLRCPSLAATITSGHLGATFAVAPQRVSVTLRSAQAALWLPGSTAYAVSGQVTAGYLHAGIPQNDSSPRAVIARIDSGELDLLAR